MKFENKIQRKTIKKTFYNLENYFKNFSFYNLSISFALQR